MNPQRIAEYPIDPLFLDRWSPRAFTGEAMTTDTLMRLFEAARWAPSASNLQPWRFAYGLAGTAGFARIFDALVPFNQGWAGAASALVVVVSARHSIAPGHTEAKPNRWHSFDTGAAWASLALQAHLLGWQTHGMAGFDAERLRQALGLDEAFAIEAVVAIGKRGDAAGLPEALRAREHPSQRRPLADLVHDASSPGPLALRL
jgi:nitroreductase